MVIPALLIHHYWNDTFVFGELFDEGSWIDRAKSGLGVEVVRPSELTGEERSWYERCAKAPSVPDPGRLTTECKKTHANLKYDNSVDEAVAMIQPILARGGMATAVTLKRIDGPRRDPAVDLVTAVARAYAHFSALRPHPTVRELAGRIVAKLPDGFIAVHIRQELDTLALSGCIYEGHPQFEQAEATIRNWGGWDSRPLEAARSNRRKYGGEAALRRAGKCGVDVHTLVGILDALETPSGTAIYVAGSSTEAGTLGPLSRKGKYSVWTKETVLGPTGLLAPYANHASFLSLVDAEVSTAAELFVTARGNFDRAVVARRLLRHGRSVDSHAVFGRRRNGDMGGLGEHLRSVGMRPPRSNLSYTNPLPVQARCPFLDAK